MSNIASNPIQITITDPEEFDPVALLELAIDKFHIRANQFAKIFGTEAQTLSNWRSGRRNPTRQCRIRAASLKKEWGLI